MIEPTGVAIAQAIAALGATGILALLFVLWLSGKLHSDPESKSQTAQWARELDYREKLRQEAVEDRRAADERVRKLTDAVKESNELTRRALDLNERLVEEFVRPSDARTRRSDR